MKSNYDYLKETLNDEQMEFLDALVSEHNSEIKELENENAELNEEIERLESKVSDLENQDYETVDFGFGKLEYVQPDNLRIQNFMETLKERI